ncbi:hypothetical protein QF002_003085 [Paraburkholderia youngii]
MRGQSEETDAFCRPALLPRRGSYKKTGPRPRFPCGLISLTAQTENDEPQPQVVVAFGFLMTNCAPLMSSL